MGVLRRFQAKVAAGKLGLLVLVGRPRADDRHGGHQAVDVPTATQLQQAGHRRRLDVEDPARLPGLYQFINTLIRVVDPLKRFQRIRTYDLRPTTFDLQIPTAIPDHAQAGLTEQVHLEQPEILDGVHRHLGHGEALGAAPDRRETRQRPVGDDHAAGVHHRMARKAVQVHRPFHRLPETVVRPGPARLDITLPVVEELLQGTVGEPLAPGMRLMRRHAHGLGHLGHRGPSLERGKAADHGHPVEAVAVIEPGHDLLAPVPWQVKVDIRQLAVLHPFPVEEAFKTQPEAEGTDVGHPEGVTDEAPRRAPPGQQGNVPPGALVHHLGEDKEISGVSSFRYNGQLPPEPLQQLPAGGLAPPRVGRPVAAHHPAQAAPRQKAVLARLAGRRFPLVRPGTDQRIGQVHLSVAVIKVAGPGKGPRLPKHLRHPGKAPLKRFRGKQAIVTRRQLVGMPLSDPGQGTHGLQQLKEADPLLRPLMPGPAHDHPAIPPEALQLAEGPPLQELFRRIVPAELQPEVVPAAVQQLFPRRPPARKGPNPATVGMLHPDGTGEPDILRRFRLQALNALPLDLTPVGLAHQAADGRIAGLVTGRQLKPASDKVPHPQAAAQHHPQTRPVAGLGKFHPAIKAPHFGPPGPRVATGPQALHQLPHRPPRPVKTVGAEIPQTEHNRTVLVNMRSPSRAKRGCRQKDSGRRQSGPTGGRPSGSRWQPAACRDSRGCNGGRGSPCAAGRT